MDRQQLSTLNSFKNFVESMGAGINHKGFLNLATLINPQLVEGHEPQSAEMLATYYREGRFPSAVIEAVIKAHDAAYIPTKCFEDFAAIVDNDVSGDIVGGIVKLAVFVEPSSSETIPDPVAIAQEAQALVEEGQKRIAQKTGDLSHIRPDTRIPNRLGKGGPMAPDRFKSEIGPAKRGK